ncbi:MAG: flagellin [Pseudomonadota bacterium]|nr:flagellin [Pseudomonadota bacterium]
MIRIPRASLFDLVRTQSGRQAAALAEMQSRAVTGLAVQSASDDPVAFGSAQAMASAVADQDVWSKNASAAVSVQTTADTALASVADVLVRAKELAVAMAGDTVDADARAAAAIEVRGLQETLRSAANTQFGDRFVFAGQNWDTEPFAADGTYSGGAAPSEVRVAEDRWVAGGFDGSAVFAGDADVFGALEGLATALEANDGTGIGTALDTVDASIQAVSDARAQIGVETQIAEDAAAVSDAMGVLFSERLTSLVAADPVETYTRLTELKSAYESTLQIAAATTTKSLLDYLS